MASFENRSFQEKKHIYKTVALYFQQHFRDADIAFVSSHLNINDIEAMIANGKSRYFNVNAIFWSNSIENNPDLKFCSFIIRLG